MSLHGLAQIKYTHNPFEQSRIVLLAVTGAVNVAPDRCACIAPATTELKGGHAPIKR